MTDLGEFLPPSSDSSPLPQARGQISICFRLDGTAALTPDYVHVGQIMAATGSTWDDALGAYFRAVADVRFLRASLGKARD